MGYWYLRTRDQVRVEGWDCVLQQRRLLASRVCVNIRHRIEYSAKTEGPGAREANQVAFSFPCEQEFAFMALSRASPSGSRGTYYLLLLDDTRSER